MEKLSDKLLGIEGFDKRVGTAAESRGSGFWSFFLTPLRELKVGLGIEPASKAKDTADSGFVDSRIDWERYSRLERQKKSTRHKKR